ncbi:hypothetical protein R1sor_015636 [Riccia sorocarpa]|uniref:Uncharacterized protein n=1 Tax=Riccia sorocarpa TaxID=122646 RepID=A0ABD3HCT2_9MARC
MCTDHDQRSLRKLNPTALAMPGSAIQQLYDLEHQLFEARQQLVVFKRNARSFQARLQKDFKCPTCHLLEANSERNTIMPAEILDTRRGSADTSNTTKMQTRAHTRIQTRRQQHAARLQQGPSYSNGSSGKDGDSGPLEGMSGGNADGLLLAVDKFLSTAESQSIDRRDRSVRKSGYY